MHRLRSFLTSVLTGCRRRLAALIALATALLTFGYLAEEAGAHELMSWDAPVARFVHGLDSRVLDHVFHVFTVFGGGSGLLLLFSIVAVGLVAKRRFRDALFVTLAVWGTPVLSKALKEAFGRPRPGLADQGDQIFLRGTLRELLAAVALVVLLALLTRWWRYGLLLGGVYLLALAATALLGLSSSPTSGLDSFPSGHGTGSFAFAAASVWLAWRTRWRLAALLAAGAFVVGVGLSRVYFGVHYPSDVLAGWSVSLAWLALLQLLAPPVFSAIERTLTKRSPAPHPTT